MSETPARRRKARERRVLDYLFVVREHWLAALAVMVFVAGGFFVWTLYATPTFETRATIQLEEKGAEQQVLAELSTLDTGSTVETEMEVMRSSRICELAANNPAFGLTSVCWEEHAYRPLASLAQDLGQRAAAAVIRVRTQEPPEQNRRMELAFDEAGTSVTVSDPNEGTKTVAFAPGQPFTALGRTLTIEVETGPVAGRRFVLRLRAPKATERWLQSRRVVEMVGDRTGIASIRFKAVAPAVARDAVNALAQSYLAHRKQKRKDDLRGTKIFLEDRIKLVQADLDEAVTERDSYTENVGAARMRARVASIARDQAETKLRRVELERLLDQARQSLDTWKQADTFEERLSLLATTKVDALTSSLATEFSTLTRQLEFLESQFEASHPQVKAAKTKLESVRRQLEGRIDLIAKATLRQHEQDVRQSEKMLEQTAETLKGYEKELEDYPEIERNLTVLDRAVETHRSGLERLQERLVEVEIAEASDKVPASLLDSADLPTGRLSPNLAYMSILGIVFGLLAGLGLAFLLDALDQRVRSPDALEDGLAITSFASIPAFTSVRKKDRRAMKGPLVTIDSPRSVISEAYRSLRANMRYATQDKQIRAVAITSALSGEGKTVTTLNLGVVLAQGGSTAVVIDADMRRSMVHAYMGAERTPGLTEVLLGETNWSEALKPSSQKGLSLITSGRRHEHPGELLDSKAFQDMLAEVKEAFDYVLIDMPPVLAVADAAPFFASLDGVFLLCRSGRCPIGVYQGAMEQVERLGGKVLGTIFNGFDARRVARKGYGYHGYYGYYGYHAYYAYDESRRKKKQRAELPQETAAD